MKYVAFCGNKTETVWHVLKLTKFPYYLNINKMNF